MRANKETYDAIRGNRTYSEMTDLERFYCISYEINHYLPLIDNLRSDGVEDYKISAYLQDLYVRCLVCDDICIASEARISEGDNARGQYYRLHEWNRENPLIQD